MDAHPGASVTSGEPSVGSSGAAAMPEDVVERIRRGDAAALEALFHAYAPRLCRTVQRYVGAADVAEDVVQEIFLKIWRGRATWRVAAGVEAYLLLAARNQAYDCLKHARVAERWREREIGRAAGGVEAASEPDVLVALARAEDAAAIERALAELPARQRVVCELRWREQLSYIEIARRLGISVRTVENQLGRAIKRIRAALGEGERG
jgi:RNA polymerase sigma-70 factor (family 1)